jgi:hypothetical protein
VAWKNKILFFSQVKFPTKTLSCESSSKKSFFSEASKITQIPFNVCTHNFFNTSQTFPKSSKEQTKSSVSCCTTSESFLFLLSCVYSTSHRHYINFVWKSLTFIDLAFLSLRKNFYYWLSYTFLFLSREQQQKIGNIFMMPPYTKAHIHILVYINMPTVNWPSQINR